ncbi:unnamed protein product, partial [Brugia pahangi]|uniref:Uncharacterized protein n=1 Tax=Brugia pahangi TaxID=6280 RepID=A0A0N4TAJ3_BRUPA
MTEEKIEEKNDNAEKIDYVEFLRTTGQLKTKIFEIIENNTQNLNNSLVKQEHSSCLSNSKSLPQIRLKRNEIGSKSMDDEINSNTTCTFYEAVSTSNYSVDKNQQCEVSKLTGPPTVSTLPSILRPPKRWQKKAYYSLDSSQKQ